MTLPTLDFPGGARDPKFYSGTFCVGCGQHFPLDQFVWSGTEEQVGS